MSNIPAYPLGNFQERQKLQRRLLGWLPWKQTVLETRPFPLNEKLLNWKPPFLSASFQQLFCSRCPSDAEAKAQQVEAPGRCCSGTGHSGWTQNCPLGRGTCTLNASVWAAGWWWIEQRIHQVQVNYRSDLSISFVLELWPSHTGQQLQNCRTWVPRTLCASCTWYPAPQTPPAHTQKFVFSKHRNFTLG